jgi:hypothetical protein
MLKKIFVSEKVKMDGGKNGKISISITYVLTK